MYRKGHHEVQEMNRVYLRMVAYLTAGLSRAKRMPAFSTFLKPPRPAARVVRGDERRRLQATHEEIMRRMGG
jgi:hypothetical protein